MAKLGVAIPRTVLLPQKGYPADIDLTSESLHNLAYPIDWDGLLDYVGRPAILPGVDDSNVPFNRVALPAPQVQAVVSSLEPPQLRGASLSVVRLTLARPPSGPNRDAPAATLDRLSISALPDRQLHDTAMGRDERVDHEQHVGD